MVLCICFTKLIISLIPLWIVLKMLRHRESWAGGNGNHRRWGNKSKKVWAGWFLRQREVKLISFKATCQIGGRAEMRTPVSRLLSGFCSLQHVWTCICSMCGRMEFFSNPFLLPFASLAGRGSLVTWGEGPEALLAETPDSRWRPWPWSEKGALVRDVWVEPTSVSGVGARSNGHPYPKDTGAQLQAGVASQGSRGVQRHVGEGERPAGH